MTRAVLSIGSNLGDRTAHLRSVVTAFEPQLVAVSSVYSTAPWGGVPQQHYLNAVVVVDDPAATPLDWLRRGQELEQAARRVREVRWGARTLDVDVVWAERNGVPVRSTDATLTLPHPHAHERAFVLLPWVEVEPAAEVEVAGERRSIAQLLAELDIAERQGVRRTEFTLRVHS